MSRFRGLRKSAAGSSPVRLGLAVKFAFALAVCLALRVALAQPGVTTSEEGVDAQGFKILIPHKNLTQNTSESKTALQKLKNSIRLQLGDASPLGDKQRTFENYYNMYYFPIMTQTTDEALKGLPDERQRFLSQQLEYCKSPTTHALLASMALNEMNRIVSGGFHPAVRYNAMLIISSLNDQEASRTSPMFTPEPMGKALPFILDHYRKCVKPEDDGVKLAALLGLARHLEWDEFRNGPTYPPIQGNLKKEIIDEILKLAQMKDAPAGRDPEGHVWFRRRAVEALGFSCAKKADATIAGTLDAMLKDEKEPLLLRLTVATTLGKISLADPAKIDPKATATELGYLALVACDTELNRVANLKKTEEEHMIRLAGQLPGEFSAGGFAGPGNTGPRGEGFGVRPMPGPGPGLGGAGVRPSPLGGPGAGAFGGEGGAVDPSLLDPKHYRFEYARRRLRQQLYCVQVGLLGGEDYVVKTAAATTPIVPKAGTPTTSGPATPQAATTGMRVIAKTPDVKTYVEDVYTKVRDMADIVENRTADMPSLDKELRRKMKPLEDITRKLAPPPAPAAANAAEDDDLLNPGGAKPAPMPPAVVAPMPPGTPAAPMPPAGGASTPMPPAGGAPVPTPPAATPPAVPTPAPPAAPPGKAP